MFCNSKNLSITFNNIQVLNNISINVESNKTTIIIAHRLSTVKHCDYIYRIEKGVITDQGDYSSVVGKE